MTVRPSARATAVRVVLTAAACILPGIFLWRPAALLWLPAAGWLWLLHRSRRITLAKNRIAAEEGLLARRRREALLRDILFISVSRGPAAQLAGYCRLTLHLSGKRMPLFCLAAADAERVLEGIRAATGEASA